MDALGCFLAAGHGLHHGLGSIEGVPAGKDPLQRRLKGEGIGFQPPPGREGDPFGIRKGQIPGLADRHDDRIALDDPLGAR